MRKVFLAMLLGIFLFTSAFVSAAEYVVVTSNGSVYHPVDSRYSTYQGAEKITKEEAESRGLKPSKSYLAYLKRLEKESQPKEVKTQKDKVK